MVSGLAKFTEHIDRIQLKMKKNYLLLGGVMSQQQGNQGNTQQPPTQANMQQLTHAQRQQQINQMVQQQQMDSNIKQNQTNNPIQNNPLQSNVMQNNAMLNNTAQNQGQNLNQSQGMGSHSQQMSGQQQWNFNQMQGNSGPNQAANTSQPQQMFNPAAAGMNRFERPQINNPTSKQALTMMLRQRHPSSFMNATNNAQQGNISGLPFNIQQRQQQLMRTAAMRNVNPAQMQANAAANQMNSTNVGNPISGASIQQRQVCISIVMPFRLFLIVFCYSNSRPIK